MTNTINSKRLGWLCLGILIGFVLTAVMPARPLHAVATQGQDGFALATGLIDTNVEAVYFLDYLTGDLRGAVLNLALGKFTTFYTYNILNDLQVDLGKNPKFLMVTGIAALRRGPQQTQPGQSVVYVMEVNSGNCAAYAVSWNTGRSTQTNPQPQELPFIPLDRYSFRRVAVRQ